MITRISVWAIALLSAASAVSAGVDLKSEWQRQWGHLAAQIKARSSAKVKLAASQAYHPAATILTGDRDGLDIVLRRTSALLADLRAGGRARGDLGAVGRELDALRTRAAAIEPTDASGRYSLYERVCGLRRRIALANPLLDFDEILFIRRQRALFRHMCDQFYGMGQVPGGGLYVLSGAFGESPTVRNVLADATVSNGRLKGQRLSGGPDRAWKLRYDGSGNLSGEQTEGGSFLSPELSFDGREILFAYVECRGERKHRHHTDPARGHWDPGRCYHVFRVNVDGSGLTQLTDGTWNDFDPAWLPDGRVAFVSERRGGYLRCGRVCPTYTLFTMNGDGSGIECLSYHETHEWQPSVAHDGRIAYTRWDYVDRDTNVAHHIWLCYPDGRDPRSFHGNYPRKRGSRPWMEMNIRAIPGSRKFLATAGAHHGQASGSLVVIDQDGEDDGAMAQVRRFTPDCLMPEAEGPWARNNAYDTAWPLSEKYCLASYDPAGRSHGIYLVDCFGNRELIWRDDKGGLICLDPIPLKARKAPPVIPPQTAVAAPAPAASADADCGTVAVMNFYDSDFDWPADAKVTHLRIIQLLPKSTPAPNGPRIGAGNQTNARAVLGTVPVEADGSCHFTMPAGKAVYFQALDKDGLAVQSMRSATYVQAGRVLSCQGCHEPKRTSPAAGAAVPMAMRRPPSKIQPECEQANPFGYVRLVQPVLDKHCVSCHTQRKALDLSGTPAKGGFTTSYVNLARKYGTFYEVRNGSIRSGDRGGARSVPGKFGARAAKLVEYLGEKHYGVKMSDSDRRRITIWLDCNSEFLGAYEDPKAQQQGKVVKPSLE